MALIVIDDEKKLIAKIDETIKRLFEALLFNRACEASMSRPRSWSDPIGESEPVSGCETIYWDSSLLLLLLLLFFFTFQS